MPKPILTLMFSLSLALRVAVLFAGTTEAQERPAYCSIEGLGSRVETVRPAPGEPPIDDVNWFARPVPNAAGDWIIGFASHNENYLYDLTRGRRVRIPDRSDAVATPDGRYMTVPGTYTPDGTVRFYDLPELLARLVRGEDAAEVEPVYAHRHDNLGGSYYQSVGVLGGPDDPAAAADFEHHATYRMIFSGNPDPAGFRMVDYEFVREAAGGTRDELRVTATAPMQVCPDLVRNDLNTPFFSKDGRYIAAYSSSSPERLYTDGSSLRIFEITGTDPQAGTSSCVQRVDFGFAAGKADFSFDNESLTFHIARGQYLVPFINGGLPRAATTDVVVVELRHDAAGTIVGYGDMARVTTSQVGGVGSYFPAFLPDEMLFYIHNLQPRDADGDKRFTFTVVDPRAELYLANLFADPEVAATAATIAHLWQGVCEPEREPFAAHEAPWMVKSLSAAQCNAVLSDGWKGAAADGTRLASVCAALSNDGK